MNLTKTRTNLLVFLLAFSASGKVLLTQDQAQKSSYLPVVTREEFSALMNRMKTQKAELASRHRALLEARYDLTDRPVQGFTMSRGKAVQAGIRVKLAEGLSWDKIAQMAPEEILDSSRFLIQIIPKEEWVPPLSY